MERIGVEEMNLMDAQVVTFSSDMYNTSRLPLMFASSDSSRAAGGDTPSALPLEDVNMMGVTYVSIPIQIIQDLPLQQLPVTTDSVSNSAIFVDPSQLAYLSNGQLVLTEDGLITSGSTAHMEKHSLLSQTADSLVDTSRSIGGSLSALDLTCLGGTVGPGGLLLDGERIIQIPDAVTATSNISEVVESLDKGIKLKIQENLVPFSKLKQQDTWSPSPPINKKGPFKCETCNKEFLLWSHYRKHRKMHMEDKPHRCPNCPASFNVATNLLLHGVTHNVDDLECPECHKMFSRAAGLRAHIILHEREESLFCTECGDEFSNQIQLDKHMKLHEEEWVKPANRVYKCQQCDRQYSRASLLREHMKDHYKVKATLSAKVYKRAVRRGLTMHTCDICHKCFQKPSQLIRHRRIHTGEKPFKCDVCPSAFNQKGSLLIHMSSKHNGMRPFACESCHAAFSQKGNLRAHTLRLHSVPHLDETVYRCSNCSCVFRKLGSLNAHMNRMHQPVNEVVNTLNNNRGSANLSEGLDTANSSKDTSDKENDHSENKQTVFTQNYITIANKLEDGSISQTTMRQRRMGSVRWHQCTYCSKEFKKPSDLVRHVRIHTHEKPYKCKFCLRAFAVRSSLVTHMQTHTGAKNYVCNICNKSYATSSSLKVHRQSHIRKSLKESQANADNMLAKADSLISEVCAEVPTEIQQVLEETTTAVQEIDPTNKLDSTQFSSVTLQHPIQSVINSSGLINNLVEVVTVTPHIMKNENSDRPHRCMMCNSAFRKSNHLKMHIRKHTGERPFRCQKCNRNFISNGILKTHLRTHLGIKTHKCDDCGKYFSTKGSLRRHSETHAIGLPFVCPFCPKTYKTQASCRKHMKTHKLVVQKVVHTDDQTVELQHISEASAELESVDQQNIVNESGEEVISTEDAQDVEVQEEIPSVEALIINSGVGQPYIITSRRMNEVLETQTLHADATGTITLSTLSGQDALSQESMREIEETLNQQLFGNTTELELNEDKEEAVLFDQGFESCVFSAITLQGDQLELGSGLTTTNLANILPPSKDQECSVHRCETCGEAYKNTEELESHLQQAHAVKDNWTCEICDKNFSSKPSYRLHVKSHGREKEHECNYCGSRYTMVSSLVRHMAIHSDEKNFVCPVCGSSYRTEAQLRRHSNEHKESRARPRRRRGEARQLTEEETKQLANQVPQQGATVSERVLIASVAEKDRISDLKDPGEKFECEPLHPNQCKYCPKSFQKPSDLVRHLRTHTGEKPYQCDFCNKCFTVKSTLDSHLKTHSAQKQCNCHVCGYNFATKGSLKVHMRLHTGSKPFRCPVCDQRFRTSGHRKAHLMSHIKEVTNRDSQFRIRQIIVDPSQQITQQTIDANQPQETEEQDQIQVQQPQEQTEVQDQNGNKPLPSIVVSSNSNYVCEVCNKSFSKNYVLLRHMRVHTGERPFTCKVCNKGFSQKNSLQIHSINHTGERPWNCPECNMSFTQKGNLKTHIRRVHQFSQHAVKVDGQTSLLKSSNKLPTTFTTDLADKTLDIDRMVSDLFPQMRSTDKHSSNVLGGDEL